MTTKTYEYAAFGDSPETRLLKLMQGVDTARNDFLLASTRYRSMPTKSYLSKLVNSINTTTSAVGETVNYILNEESTDSTELKGKMVETLLSEDDKKRVAHYNNLFADEDFSEIDLEGRGFAEYVVSLVEEEEPDVDPTNVVMGIYFRHSEIDLKRFIDAVAETKNAKFLRVADTVGQNAIELSKITAAAALGAWIATRAQRK